MSGFFQTFFAACLGAFLASLGKEWLGYSSGKSVRLQDRDRDLLLVEQTLNDVRDLASRYWSEDGPTENGPDLSSFPIISRLLKLGQIIERLFEGEDELAKMVNTSLNHFDDCITQGNFGVHGRQAEPFRVFEIDIQTDALANLVLRSRRKLTRKFLLMS